MSKIFVDTNIIVYALDQHELKKRQRCQDLLQQLVDQHSGVISTQVMGECYAAAVRKLHADPLIVKNILHSLEHFEIITIAPDLIYDAIDCSIVNQLSFWDSLIIVTAAHAHCQQLWTEDLQPGRVIHGVEIYHPLKPAL